jgi:hypothetical protein
MNILRLFLIWLLMSVIAVINGTIRVIFFEKLISAQLAHVLSTITGITLIQAVIYFYLGNKKFPVRQLLLTGLFWLGLTVLFEFGFGHYVVGHPWEKLLADYNLLKGRLRSLVLVSILLGPLFWGAVLSKR